jgi:hypothetical protein
MVIREWMSVRRDKQIPHDQAAALAKAVAQRSRLLAGRRDRTGSSWVAVTAGRQT